MKGSVMDIPLILVVVLISAVSLFLMHYLIVQFQAAASGVPMIAGNAAAMGVLGQGQDTLEMMDSLFAFFVVMLCLVTIIAAFMLPTHPVFFIVALLLTCIAIPIAAEFGNLFEALYSTGPLVGTESYFPVTVLIFQWLPKITAVMSFTIGAVMYWRSSGGGRGGY